MMVGWCVRALDKPPRFIRSSWVQPLAVHDGWTGQMAILGSCQRIQEPHPISGALVEVPSSKVYKTCPDCAFSMFFSNPPSSGYPVEAAQFNWVDLSKNQRAIDHRAMRSIAMESGEMEDAAPLIQEPAAKSTKALLAMTGGRWWRMARVFPQLVGYFLTPYPDNFWYVYTYTVYIYIHVYLCVWELNTSWSRHLVVWWRICTFLGAAVLGFPIV